MSFKKIQQKKFRAPMVIICLTIITLSLFKIFDYNNIFSKVTEKNTTKKINFNFDEKKYEEDQFTKQCSVNETPKIYLGGYPIGIKMNTEGLLVVGFSDIEIDNTRMESPAEKSGIKIGDSILKVENQDIKSSKELTNIINKSNSDVNFLIARNDKILNIKIKPIKSATDGVRKVGLWVRDSTAGVGTMTFYCRDKNIYGALGHPITDVDTNSILKVRNGEIVNAAIIGVKKGQKGNPGELRGVFINDTNTIGNIKNNTQYGIYGDFSSMQRSYEDHPIEIMTKDMVKEGKAQIYTTIDEEGPKFYDVEIIKKYEQNAPDTKSLVIHVTDKRLLDKTGGIVQGMSGSPIIQDGKLCGAVTHVLVNRADVGYGVYIEWMLKDSGIL